MDREYRQVPFPVPNNHEDQEVQNRIYKVFADLLQDLPLTYAPAAVLNYRQIPYFAPTHHAHAHSHERSRNSPAANSL